MLETKSIHTSGEKPMSYLITSSKMIKNQIQTTEELKAKMSKFSSPEKVAANEDLLTEILIRLPVKSLLQFKSVSKHWLSLITSPPFARCWNPDQSYVSGLLLYSSMRRSKWELNFIPLRRDGINPPDDDSSRRALTTFPGLPKVGILSSCNGLLCCSSFTHTEHEGRYQYHIVNPTTKQFTSLPQPHDGLKLKGLSLAFDPSRSPHYKVVCVCSTASILSTRPHQNQHGYQVEIYSSETHSWRVSSKPFNCDVNSQFLWGVYWNGAIHWFSILGDSLYFNIEDEHFGIIPMPPVPDHGDCNAGGRPFRYYGESRDHLHLVEIYGLTTRFDVYEMKRDYSGWFVKYRVDLNEVGIAFPNMTKMLPIGCPTYYSFAILSLVKEKNEERSFLVLHVPGKIIRYCLADKSFDTICDIAAEHCDDNGMIEDCFRYFRFHSFEYIESLSPV